MSNYDGNTTFGMAAVTRSLSALGTEGTKFVASVMKFSKLASDIASVQNNDKYPQNVKDSLSAAMFLATIAGTILPNDIKHVFEATWDIAATVPENLGNPNEQIEDFFDRLNEEYGNDLFPLDEDGLLDLPTFDPDDPGTVIPPASQNLKPSSKPTEAHVGDSSDAFDEAEDHITPLVLDLDGDGIEVSSLTGSEAVYWDIDLDGFAEASAWATGGDGLLAFDLNNDGVINDHSELFGDQTGSADGFAALAVFDSNTDGYITSADAQFDDLLVWIDSNNDGYSEVNELHTLDDLGITSITLAASVVSYSVNGNDVKLESTFTINGNTRTISDVWFDYDDLNTVYIGDQTIVTEALYLPSLRGYGEVADLIFGMSQDSALYDMVLELGQAEAGEMFSSAFDLRGRVTDILFRWAGVDGVDPESRGTDIDARVLEFLEKYLANDFLYEDGSNVANPNDTAAIALYEAFDDIFDDACIDLLTQLDARVYVGQAAVYDNMTGTVSGDYMINNLLFNEGAGVDYLYGGEKSDGFIWSLGDGDDVFTEEGGGLDKVLFAEGIDVGGISFESSGADLKIHIGTETITLIDQFHHYLYGNGTNYQIEYAVFEDGTHLNLLDNLTFTGTASVDNIYGYLTDDTFDGKGGADYFVGRDGDDQYLWDVGYGDDTIIEDGGTDALVMADGITIEDIRLARSGSFDLEVYVGTEKITISDQLRDAILSTTDGYAVEVIRFSDNSTLDLVNDLTLTGTSSADAIYGLADDNVLIGADGDDGLLGGAGNDVLYGGAGTDSLYGQDGADTFVFEAASAFSNVDTVEDFDLSDDDVIDIADLLTAYDPLTDLITDFVQITDNGSHSYLAVDVDGGANNFVQIATLYGVTGLTDEAALESGGYLKVA